MSQNPLVPSFRFPGVISDPSVPKAVSDALRMHSNALTDIYQAIPVLKQQIASLARSPGITTIINNNSNSGGGSGTFPGLGSVNDLQGIVSYTNQPTDNGALLLFGDASPVAVQLTGGVPSPYFFFTQNWDSGAVTFTPTSGTISSIGNPGATSLTLEERYSAILVFDGTNWWAETLQQLSFADISGVATTAQIGTGTPAAGEYVDGGTGAWTPLPSSTVLKVNIQTANYTALSTDQIIQMNSTAATTVTLPTTSVTVGRVYCVKNVGAGTCTVAPATGSIDSHPSISIAQWQAYQFYWDGSTWHQSSQSLSI
ncbi:MAG: hypothetical protein ACYCOU_00140 [Sulfobacillus sp.]